MLILSFLGVAQERLTIRDVYEMLTIPSKYSWCSQTAVLPPQGLYLCQVTYDDKDKEFPIDAHSDHMNSNDNELPK